MPWIVKLDKEEDFIGRWALEAVKERGDENKLVGFTIANGVVPTEGAAVVARRQAGRAGHLVALLAEAAAHDRDGVGAGRPGRGRRRDDVRRRRAADQRRGADGAVLRPRPGAAARMSCSSSSPRMRRRPSRARSVLRSPIEWIHRDAGAELGERAGWRWSPATARPRRARRLPATPWGSPISASSASSSSRDPRRRRRGRRRARRRRSAGPGRAALHDEVWWCPVTPEKVLAVTPPERTAGLREEIDRAGVRRRPLRLGDRADHDAGLQRRRRAARARDIRPGDGARPPPAEIRAGGLRARSRSRARPGWSCASATRLPAPVRRRLRRLRVDGVRRRRRAPRRTRGRHRRPGGVASGEGPPDA